ncbi:MAG: NAD-dependent epimerase/dehydratase family protein [Alphaproteobacteria bacterium]|nr:NAD-dependent epimerase/dehydratase family protein [Alphaproteobacteria bacterium]
MSSRRDLLSNAFKTLSLALVAGPMITRVAPAGAVSQTKLSVAVLGATGRTGKRVVDILIAQGHSVRGISRSAAQQQSKSGVAWINADVREPNGLQEALKGADALIYAVGVDFTKVAVQDLYDVYHLGVEAAAKAAQGAGVKRFVLLSSAGRVSTGDLPPELRASMDSKAKGESALKTSGIAYTIVRTPGIWDRAGGELGIMLLQTDLPSGGPYMINRDDIAAVLVECATNDGAQNKAFTILNAATFEVGSWRKALSVLKAD